MIDDPCGSPTACSVWLTWLAIRSVEDGRLDLGSVGIVAPVYAVAVQCSADGAHYARHRCP